MNDQPIQSPLSAPLLKTLIVLAWLAWAAMFIKCALVNQFTVAGVDFPKHHTAALAVLEGESPYIGDNYLGFNYPLFLAWLYVFLAPFSLSGAEVVYDALNALYVVAALLILIFYCRPKRPEPAAPSDQVRLLMWRHWPSLSALLTAAFTPIWVRMHDGNIEPLNLVLAVALVAAALRGAQTLAGLLLAMLCLVKILPVLFILPFLLAGYRRLVSIWAIALGAYGAILLGAGWWRWEWLLYSDVLPQLGFHYRGVSSSLTVMAGKWFAPAIIENESIFNIVSRTIAALFLVLSLGALAVGWRAARVSWRPGLSLLSIAIVLMTPLLEYHHIIWAMPAYVLLFVDYVEKRLGGRPFAAMVVLWYAVFAFGHAENVVPGYHLPTYPLYLAPLALVGLWGCAAMGIGRPGERSSLAP